MLETPFAHDTSGIPDVFMEAGAGFALFTLCLLIIAALVWIALVSTDAIEVWRARRAMRRLRRQWRARQTAPEAE